MTLLWKFYVKKKLHKWMEVGIQCTIIFINCSSRNIFVFEIGLAAVCALFSRDFVPFLNWNDFDFSTGLKSSGSDHKRMREVECPTCTIHLQVCSHSPTLLLLEIIVFLDILHQSNLSGMKEYLSFDFSCTHAQSTLP